MFHPCSIGFMGGPPPKAPPTLRDRIMRILNGRIVTGRAQIMSELHPNGFTLEDQRIFNWTLKDMIAADEVAERRVDVPGAHEFPAAIEHTYRLRGTSPGYPRDLRGRR